MRWMFVVMVCALTLSNAGAMEITVDVPLGAPGSIVGETGVSPWAPGLSLAGEPGEIMYPVRRLFIPVPPGSAPTVSARPLGLLPMPAPEGGWARMPRLEGYGLESTPVEAPLAESSRRRAELLGVTHLMGVPVAVVDVCPMAADAPSSWAENVSVTLSFGTPARTSSPVPAPLRRVLHGDGAAWRSPGLQWPDSPFWGSPWARIAVPATGGYQLTAAQLEQAGCDVSGAPVETLRMLTGPGVMFGTDPSVLHTPSEVPIVVEDRDGDGQFDGSDRVRFLARGIQRWMPQGDSLRWMQHRYATHNVYWLSWGGEEGSRVSGGDAAPDGSAQYGEEVPSWTVAEQELQRMADDERRTGWVWEILNDGESFQTTLQLDRAGTWDLDLRILVDGGGVHSLRVSLNGEQVASQSWSVSGSHWLRIPNQPLGSSNQIDISYSVEGGDDPQLALDLLKVRTGFFGGTAGRTLFPGLSKQGRYTFSMTGIPEGSSVFDITDFNSPTRLDGCQPQSGGLAFSWTVSDSTRLIAVEEGQWLTPDSVAPASPGRLLSTVSSGDRLFVAPPSLRDGAWGLLQISQEAGATPVLATTREIYDEFNAGITDPGAIRSALRWGQDELSPGFQALILVGNGHYDVRQNTVSTPSLIPPYTVLASAPGGHGVCSDDFYALTHQNDVLPEMPVARIPAEDAADLASVTAKSVAYAAETGSGDWANRMIFLADDEWGNNFNQSETVHTIDCERLAEEHAPRYARREKVYLIEYPWPSGGGHPEKEDAREDFIEEFSEGSAFMAFIGHGSPNQITNEKVLRGSDVPSLLNGQRLPLTYWGTCNVGEFDIPGETCIGGRLVTSPAGGAVASVAATRGTFSSGNANLGAALIDSLYSSQGQYSIGEAVWLAKIDQGAYTNYLRYYLLMGHPDLRLAVPDTTPQLTLSAPELRSGELNRLSGNGFGSQGLVTVEVRESSVDTIYTGLGGDVINWRKYGGAAYRGPVALLDGAFELDAFVPLQSRTGNLARAEAVYLGSPVTWASALDPQPLAQGDPPDDFTGPEIGMWARGYEGVEEPRVSGEVTLEASLSDSSGICFLGGEGQSITLFLDGQGIDVSESFSYNQGSSTSGALAVELEQLSDGWHMLILRAWDGVGNMSMDTLRLQSLENEDLAIQQAIVYPNPGSGQRCFSFRITADSYVRLSIYTVSGRRIRTLSSDCAQGYNQIMWDGRDSDGDFPASGSYIYRMEASAAGSSVFDNEAEHVGILAVVEGG